jgi:uncharacterized protein YggT (Ycf19 family)
LETLAIILSRTVLLALGVIQLGMLARMILSLIGYDEEEGFGAYLMLLTEPVILPVRVLLSRFRALQELPIDLSFCVTFLLIGYLTYSLPIIG